MGFIYGCVTFLYKNLISSLSLIVFIFFWVMFVAGDVHGIFILAYFRITFFYETLSV